MVALKTYIWRSMFGVFTSLGLHWRRELNTVKALIASLRSPWIRIFILHSSFSKSEIGVGSFFNLSCLFGGFVHLGKIKISIA